MREDYRDGVAIVEAGFLPREGADPREDLQRLRQLVLAEVSLSSFCADPLPADSELLLVIDNVEHITTAATGLARQILAACPRIHLIMTSRRPVCASSAPVWDVGPLAVGDHGSDAVDLFLLRAGAACPGLDLTGCLSAVGELCGKLDGIPFALELAALRLRSVSLDTLLRDGSITHLLGQARSADLPHHGSLADSVRWSYDMLTGNQRVLLDQLVSFPAAFTLEDVERLHRRFAAPAPEVGLLAELVDSSLVQVERGPRYSYRLLGYIREFVRNWIHAAPAHGSAQPSRVP
jgi:predicted ATPase